MTVKGRFCHLVAAEGDLDGAHFGFLCAKLLQPAACVVPR